MSADDNASEQAREVEVVARAVAHKVACYSADPVAPHPCLCWPWRLKEAEVVLRALAPIRAAERQEAAREALIEAAGDIAERIAAVVDPDSWRRDGFDEGWAHAGEKIDGLLRARADGVTGRSGA